MKEYILTNGKKFIRYDLNGKYIQVNNVALAEVYPNKTKAFNVIKNSVPKAIARTFYVAEIVDGEVVQCTIPKSDEVVKTRCDFVYKVESSNNDGCWYSKFLGLDKLFEESRKRGEVISQELSDIDSEITDVCHYIEFFLLSGRDGYKIYKKLHDLLNERRRLKDEQKIIGVINKRQEISRSVEEILNAIEDCKKQSYQPRKLGGLFEYGVESLESN